MAAPPATMGTGAGHLACPRLCRQTAEVDRVVPAVAFTGFAGSSVQGRRPGHRKAPPAAGRS